VDEAYDLLIVGGGPAGLAAAAEGAAAGLAVGLADERATLGGQIYKQPGFLVRDAGALGAEFAQGRALIDAATRAGARVMLRTAAIAVEREDAPPAASPAHDGAGAASAPAPAGPLRVILAADGEPARAVSARHLLIAAGAHDRPVAFPGWTLPGVLTAGGAQTLVKTQRVLPGENMLFAGSGPLALAFPAQLHGYGATIAAVLEAGPPPRAQDIARMLKAAPGNTALLRDAIRYRAQLLRARIPLRYRRIVTRAEGGGRVESVTHAAVDADWRVLPGTEQTVACDTLCLGYGFTPSIELARLAGCAFGSDEDRGGPVIEVDEWMRTSVPNVLAAGDGTGVEGSHVAIGEGGLAVLGITGGDAAPVRRRLARKRAFRTALERMHRVGPGIYELAGETTVICRCEGVTRKALDDAIATTADQAVVKALTRASMGLCQGRNCQRQIAAMIARRHNVAPGLPTPRLPARPIALAAIARAPEDDPGRFQ
jgi:thioredoxin reductase